MIFDDYKAHPFEDCSKFGSSKNFLPLIIALRAGLKCVVADIDFCKTESREEAEGFLRAVVPSVQICRLFFENDPSTCEANVRSRNSPSCEEELKKVRDYSARYEIPHGADTRPVARNVSGRLTENRELRTENLS